jgi:hypothetical protein
MLSIVAMPFWLKVEKQRIRWHETKPAVIALLLVLNFETGTPKLEHSSVVLGDVHGKDLRQRNPLTAPTAKKIQQSIALGNSAGFLVVHRANYARVAHLLANGR